MWYLIVLISGICLLPYLLLSKSDNSQAGVNEFYINISRVMLIINRIVSEYDQEIPQSHTADKPTAL